MDTGGEQRLRAVGGGSSWVPWFFIAPFLLITLVLLAYPLIASLVLSTQRMFGPRGGQFVGLANYASLATDPSFWRALTNTAVYAVCSVVLQLPLSLGLALLLNSGRVRCRRLFQLVFFSPSLVGVVFVAILFAPVFAKNNGLLNVFLHHIIGWDIEFAWLEEYTLLALLLAGMWMYVGFNMLFFLAALRNVDPGLLDAATVDGAGSWGRFVHVTLPAIRPVFRFVVIISLIGGFQLFELPWILLDFSDGPHDRGLTLMRYLYRVGFESGDLGYASAVGWGSVIPLLLTLGCATFFLRGSRQ